MNKMIWMVLIGLFVCTGSVQANCGKCVMVDVPKADEQGMIKEHLDKMSSTLALTPEQKVQLEAIMKEKMAAKRQIMEHKEAAMKALQEQFKTKLKGVLTEEQMKKWEAKKEGQCDMKGKCPDCKKGKKCPKCQLKKASSGHGHEHDKK